MPKPIQKALKMELEGVKHVFVSIKDQILVEVQLDKLNLLEIISDWIIECNDEGAFTLKPSAGITEEDKYYVY